PRRPSVALLGLLLRPVRARSAAWVFTPATRDDAAAPARHERLRLRCAGQMAQPFKAMTHAPAHNARHRLQPCPEPKPDPKFAPHRLRLRLRPRPRLSSRRMRST